MIDWDEINWKQAVATIVLGLGLIAGGLFVIKDYLSSVQAGEAIATNLDAISAVRQRYDKAGLQDTAQMEQEAQGLEQQLQAMGVEFPSELTDEAGKAELEGLAQKNNVTVVSLEPESFIPRGFLIFHPFVLTFSGAAGNVSEFLHAIDNLPYVHEVEGRVTFSDEMKITVRLASFDMVSWEESNPCPEIIPLPTLVDMKSANLKVFKGNYAQSEQQVQQQMSDLTKQHALAQKNCELYKRRALAQEKLNIAKQYEK